MSSLIYGNSRSTTMAFEKGSLILANYTASIKETGDVFDTTFEDVAKEHFIHDEGIHYEPKLISIGDTSYPILEGVDKVLAETVVDERRTIELAPEMAFGEKNPSKIRMISIRKLGDNAEKVSVGDRVDIDGRMGTIRFIGSGRVQIDYNHRYAGKTIVYDIHVIKSVEDTDDRVVEIIKERLHLHEPDISFALADNKLSITISAMQSRLNDLRMAKNFVQSDIFKFVPTIDEVSFIEVYTNPQRPAPENTAESADQPDTAETTDADQPDTAETTDADQPDTAETTDADQPDTAETTDADQPDTAETTDADQPDTAETTDADQPDTAETTDADQPDTAETTDADQPAADKL